DKIQEKPHSSDTDFIIDEHYLAIKGRYDRLMKKNGIKLTFHEIRSLFATSMNEIGVKKEVLQKLGGWTNSKVLDSVYIRHSEKTLNDSVSMLSELIMPEIQKVHGSEEG
ncbi:MAG: tyrosine-type recombinase/integrase, partial [Oscillospiraceae bacterium]|nr:tyrosine-type recombinase/integrase [Oscillospiraceae bacterium]